MDTLVQVLAWSMSIITVAAALHNVSAIGGDQGVYTVWQYVGHILRGAAVVILAGRALGVW